MISILLHTNYLTFESVKELVHEWVLLYLLLHENEIRQNFKLIKSSDNWNKLKK